MPGAAPTFQIEAGAEVAVFRLRDIHQVNNVETPLNFFVNDGSIGRLFLDGVVVREALGTKQEMPIQGRGSVQENIGNIRTN